LRPGADCLTLGRISARAIARSFESGSLHHPLFDFQPPQDSGPC